MANLTVAEKIKLEKLFEMNTGYVLDFSNSSFQSFVFDSVGIDIYNGAYGEASKANLLRAFFSQESPNLVGKLIDDLLEYWRVKKITNDSDISNMEKSFYEECKKIPERLSKTVAIDDIDSLTPNNNDKNFQLLADSIKESINKNQPEMALDRLHTFCVKYVRELCSKHLIPIDNEKNLSLNALFGTYVKYLKDNKLIDSEMSEKILKSSISILESFNGVRNNQSLAHDNHILNYNESVLIFNNVSNTIRFIGLIEQDLSNKMKIQREPDLEWDDIEFSQEEIDAAGDEWMQLQADIARGK